MPKTPRTKKAAAPRKRPAAKNKPKAKARAEERFQEQPGEARSLRIQMLFQKAAADRDMAIDLKRAIDGATGPVRSYAEWCVMEGGGSDVQAAKALGMTAAEAEAAGLAFEKILAGITTA